MSAQTERVNAVCLLGMAARDVDRSLDRLRRASNHQRSANPMEGDVIDDLLAQASELRAAIVTKAKTLRVDADMPEFLTRRA